MDPLEILEMRLDALAGEATPGQLKALEDFVREEVGMDDWGSAAEMILWELGRASGDVYTNIRMRMGEMGIR